MADINNATDWSETDGGNNQAPPNGFPTGMFPSGVNQGMRAVMGGIKRSWDRMNPVTTTTGSAGAYVLTPANISYPILYFQGEIYAFKANFTSVGNDTLNVNSLGAKVIYKQTAAGATVLAAGDIQTGSMAVCAYDGALNGGVGGFQLLTPTSSVVPSGSIMQFAGATAPPGWLLCNGAAVSRTGFAALFAAIGTAYGGGDGSTTFNIPDGRGRVLAGMDPSNATGRLNGAFAGGASAAALGNGGGEQGHVLSGGELTSHNHGINDPGHGHGIGDPGHVHGVADPSHAHGVADPGHNHGFNDPGHAHGVADPGHGHGTDNGIVGVANQGGGFGSGSTGWDPQSFDVTASGTGIGIFGSGTGCFNSASGVGVGIFGAFTGIGIAASGTGVFVGGSGTGITTQAAGSSGAHNTVQPTLIANHIIKT